MRILAQESPGSELRLKRYGGRKFGGLKYEFRKLWGFICKILGALVKSICKLKKMEGLNYKTGGLIEFKSASLNCK
jgi:hypothetical protein